jgi:hypothetical protein
LGKCQHLGIFYDGGVTWINADISPTSASAGISILATHTVNVTSSVSMDQVTVAGTMTILNGGIVNLNNGTGFDIDIQNAGIMNIYTSTSYATTFVITVNATMNVATGGKITVGNGASSSGYSPLGTSATLVTWNNGSVLEWNTTDPFVTSGATYFPRCRCSSDTHFQGFPFTFIATRFCESNSMERPF